MKQINYEMKLPPCDPSFSDYFKEDTLFFDIETTGFSPAHSQLYLIGCLYCTGGVMRMTQFFAQKMLDEKELLSAFMDFCVPFKQIVCFNGVGFDLPYLVQKCRQFQEEDQLSSLKFIDLFRLISPYRKIFALENLKQRTMEEFLGIRRIDTFSGGMLIPVYEEYMRTEDKHLEELLLQHNADDVTGLIRLLPLLSYSRFFSGDYSVLSLVLNEYRDVYGQPAKEAVITLTLPCSIPAKVSRRTRDLSLTLSGSAGILRIKLYEGELKYFYHNYKDYFYLPQEDTAIHKSVAFYVDRNFRVKAKAANCYSRKTGIFFPQYSEVREPYFRIEYRDKVTYFEAEEEFLQDKEALKLYCDSILTALN